MPRIYIYFNDPGFPKLPTELSCSDQERLAGSVVSYARDKAAELGVPFPKRVSTGGCFGRFAAIDYKSNAVRDLIVETIEMFGFPCTLIRRQMPPIV